jgi:hypothetical protein
MKFILAFLFCTIYTGAFSKEDIIEKMAAAVCLCLKEKEIKPGATSYTTCVLEELKPHKNSIKKLIKKIIRQDNKGEDLEALDAFNEAFESAMNKTCPGQAVDYSDIFNDLLK